MPSGQRDRILIEEGVVRSRGQSDDRHQRSRGSHLSVAGRGGAAWRFPVSLKTARATRSLGPSVGWSLVLHGGCAEENEFPLCGETRNDSARRGNDALRAHIGSSASGHARPPPLRCGRSPPYLLLVTGARLARPDSSLAEATFAPAQPPFMITELLGEKINLTQKRPCVLLILTWCVLRDGNMWVWEPYVCHGNPSPCRAKDAIILRPCDGRGTNMRSDGAFDQERSPWQLARRWHNNLFGLKRGSERRCIAM